MESIRVKNFRSLQDTGEIQLKPITVLVGKNSSGKSSFLRTFPLFKQSVEERTKAPILLYSRNGVDFGTFSDVKSIHAAENDLIEFEFVIKGFYYRKDVFQQIDTKNEIPELKVCIKIDSNGDSSPVLKKIDLNFFDSVVSIESEGKVTINGVEEKFENKNIYVNHGFLIFHEILIEDLQESFGLRDRDLKGYTEGKISSILDEVVKNSNITFKGISGGIQRQQLYSLNEMTLNNKQRMIDDIRDLIEEYEGSIEPSKSQKLFELITLYNLESVLESVDLYLRELFHKVKYMAPVRATAERYYRIQDLSVDEVDSDGKNLPMFLGSLSAEMMENFQSWTKKYFNFQVKIKKIEGHYSIKILHENDFEVNISDMGFGYSQILPIITQLWYSIEKRTQNPFDKGTPTTFVMEQPELHLHPEFQAAFADVIVKVINDMKSEDFNIRLIIETHSQTIINRLGQNIAEENISEKEINIVVFNKDSEKDPTVVTTANFDSDGLLENWPVGFFKPTSL